MLIISLMRSTGITQNPDPSPKPPLIPRVVVFAIGPFEQEGILGRTGIWAPGPRISSIIASSSSVNHKDEKITKSETKFLLPWQERNKLFTFQNSRSSSCGSQA